MTITPIIAPSLNAIIPALTPEERWDAAGSRLGIDFIADHWFVLAAALVIIILTVLLLVVSKKQMVHKQKDTTCLFAEYARKSGLSGRERQLLFNIARKSGLKRSETIFTMGSAFDNGAAKLMEENLTQERVEGNKQLRTELSFLREKLGFQKRAKVSTGAPAKSNDLSSRQIPIGKQLHITRRRARNLADIETTVIKNNDIELTVKLTTPLESKPGDLWRARYYFGASVWEFDTSVIYCNGEILVLNHSENIRFINRRRFLRVSVNMPALIARFPFTITPQPSSDNAEEYFDEEQGNKEQRAEGRGQKTKGGTGDDSDKEQTQDTRLKPPEFVPAVVTELAGPGLRLETPLQVKVGDRVLAVLRLSEEEGQDSAPIHRGTAVSIVQDIGEVRHTKATQNGLSIAVELTGLSDSDVNELIRATNTASLKAGAGNQHTQEAAEEKEQTEGAATKPAVAQEA